MRGAAGMAGGMIRRSLFVLPPLRMLDSLGGLLLGGAAGLALVWVLGAVALQLPGQTSLRGYALESTIVQRLNEIVPPRRVLNALARIDPFPSIAGPAPPEQAVDPAVLRLPGVRRAYPSVVRVVGAACGLGIEGSGWVAGPNLVVTNAHVVAGSKAIVVGFDGGSPFDADVVLFDPKLDVALLHAPKLKASALVFATSSPKRGTEAAALGHPGGKPLRIIPAAVSNSFKADGRDIYGSSRVTRDIVELRAEIDRGDSGGPLILSDGTVGGVVYAEAMSDPTVGYALGPVAVASRVIPSVGRTTAVPTGACTR